MTTMATTEDLRMVQAALSALKARVGELENTVMVLLRELAQPNEKADL